jgi:hypothetical protein
MHSATLLQRSSILTKPSTSSSGQRRKRILQQESEISQGIAKKRERNEGEGRTHRSSGLRFSVVKARIVIIEPSIAYDSTMHSTQLGKILIT